MENTKWNKHTNICDTEWCNQSCLLKAENKLLEICETFTPHDWDQIIHPILWRVQDTFLKITQNRFKYQMIQEFILFHTNESFQLYYVFVNGPEFWCSQNTIVTLNFWDKIY